MNEVALPPTYPMYFAFGEQGSYVRKALNVGELPHALRKPALEQAADVLDIEYIQYGVPIYQTLGLTKSELDADKRQWLRFTGETLPLALFWEESNLEEEA
jgi:hypothetical protein